MYLNKVKVYRRSKYEDLCSKFLPYYIPFISKRKRVKIRQHYRNKWKTRLNNDICKLLSETYQTLPIKENINWNEENYEWTVL